MSLPDPALWIGIDPSKPSQWEDFIAQNDLWHKAIYQSAQLNGLPLYVKKPNFYGKGGMQEWLATQQQEHTAISSSFKMGTAADLYDVNPSSPEEMKLWMAAHAEEHLAILQAATSPITATYNFKYDYSSGWLDTLTVTNGTATLDPTPFYRYPISPNPNWGTYPATLGDGATYSFEDGSMNGWFGTGASANTNAAYAYAGEGSLAVALALAAGSSGGPAVSLSPYLDLSANNLYAEVYLTASFNGGGNSVNLWFQDSTGLRANGPGTVGSGTGWFTLQYQNGAAGEVVPSGFNWNSIEYVGVTFVTAAASSSSLTGTYSNSSFACPLTVTYNGLWALAGATVTASGTVTWANVSGAPAKTSNFQMAATDGSGNVAYGTVDSISTGDSNGNPTVASMTSTLVIPSTGFNGQDVVKMTITMSESTNLSGNSCSLNAITQTGATGNPFTGTLYVDHVNIGGNQQTPAPLYGWGVSLPSFVQLRPLESVQSSSIVFSQSDPSPDYSGVFCRVSTNGGTTWGAWNACTSGSAIPGLTNGINGQSLAFQFNVKLYGSSTSTPFVGEIQCALNTQLTLLAPLN